MSVESERSLPVAMAATWAIEMAAESPVLEVPWQDVAGGAAYMDLRARAEGIGDILEARANPALARLLLALNAPGSRWATAKCDRWTMDAEEMEAASFDLELACDASIQCGIGSYVDLYLRDAAQFAAFEYHRELLQRLAQALNGADTAPRALVELTLRRSVVRGSDGHAITAFVYAIGEDEERAQHAWVAALDSLGRILQGC